MLRCKLLFCVVFLWSYCKPRSQSLDVFQRDINGHNSQDKLVLGLLRERRWKKQRRMSAAQRVTLLSLFLDESSPSVHSEWFQASGCNRNLDSFIPKSFMCCNESPTRHFQALLSVTLEVAPSPSRWTCELILKHLATGSFFPTYSDLRDWSEFCCLTS